MKEYDLFTFDSTHYAIRAQKLLEGFSVVVMPTLREISASCGMSLRIPPEQAKEAAQILERETEGWHRYHILQERKSIRYTLVQERSGKL